MRNRSLPTIKCIVFVFFLGNFAAALSIKSAPDAYYKILSLIHKGRLSEARREAVDVAHNYITSRSCVEEQYETMFQGYYFPKGKALEFFRADFKCVNWIRLDAKGIHVVWQGLRGSGSFTGTTSAQTVFGASLDPSKFKGRMPRYSGKLAYYDFAQSFIYGVLDSQGKVLENYSMDYPDIGDFVNAYPILESELRAP